MLKFEEGDWISFVPSKLVSATRLGYGYAHAINRVSNQVYVVWLHAKEASWLPIDFFVRGDMFELIHVTLKSDRSQFSV